MMQNDVELTQLNCRYETYRLKAPGTEKILLNSILEHGIRDPLQIVVRDPELILLDGFKRYRCACKLGMKTVPCHSLGEDEAIGIIEILRAANARSLGILEQAKLIDELMTVHKMCNADIAQLLEKSKAWVSVRSGIIKDMSEVVMKHLFNGSFPVYCYMYTLRQFRRLNSVSKQEIDEFVEAVAGKHLSTREIEYLANGFFNGSEQVREHIKNGQIKWSLDQLRMSNQGDKHCNKREQAMLKTLEISLRYIQKLIDSPWDTRFIAPSFMAQANLLSGGILKHQESFSRAIRNIHDQTGKEESHCNVAQ